MNASLRPMALGEIFDRTLNIYRASFWRLVIAWSLVAVAMAAVLLGDVFGFHLSTAMNSRNQGQRLLWSLLVGLIYFHLGALLSSFVVPAVVLHTSDAVLGRRRSGRQALAECFRRCLRFAWLGFLRVAFAVAAEVAGFALVVALFAISSALGSPNPRGWNAFFILMPLFVAVAAFLWLVACTSLAFPVSVLEDRPAWTSIRRGWTMSRGSRWRIIFAWLSLFAAFSISLGLLQWAVRWTLSFVYWRMHVHYPTAVYSVMPIIANTCFSAATGPAFPVFLTLIYYDQRIRKEGFDIEWMMQSAGMTEPMQEPAPVAPAPASVPVEELGA